MIVSVHGTVFLTFQITKTSSRLGETGGEGVGVTQEVQILIAVFGLLKHYNLGM